MDTISLTPHPAFIRAALEHADVPLPYNDDHTVSIPSGPGWDSNGNMSIPEGHVLGTILTRVLDLSMEKHVNDKMILPTNVAKIREVVRGIGDTIAYGALDEEDKDVLRELSDSLLSIARNLDPEARNR